MGFLFQETENWVCNQKAVVQYGCPGIALIGQQDSGSEWMAGSTFTVKSPGKMHCGGRTASPPAFQACAQLAPGRNEHRGKWVDFH